MAFIKASSWLKIEFALLFVLELTDMLFRLAKCFIVFTYSILFLIKTEIFSGVPRVKQRIDPQRIMVITKRTKVLKN